MRFTALVLLAATLILGFSRFMGATTVSANSVSQSDVVAAIGSAVDGDIVTVPAGTATWTRTLPVTKAITLQGAGVGQTIIKDNASGTQFLYVTLVAGKLTRLTGIEFQNGGRTPSAAAPGGALRIDGSNTNGSQFRMDHCKWVDINGFLVTNTVVGVIDHNDVIVGGPVYEWIYPYGSAWDGKTYGDGSWAAPANFGSSQFLFIEDNNATCTRTTIECSLTDGFNGARFVVRHNQLNNWNVGDHGTESPGRGRSSRAKEVYNNNFDCKNANKYPIGTRGGVVLFHDNTVVRCGGASAQNSLDSYRMFEDFFPWGGADGRNPWDKNNPGNAFATFTAAAVTLPRTVTASGNPWSANQWTGYTLHRTAGANKDYAYITSNTSNSITYKSGGYNRDMVPAVGDTYEVNKVDQSIDQPGVGQSTLISGDNPTPPANWNQVAEACYSWNNTNDGQPFNNFEAGSSNIKLNVNYFNNTKMPGYTEYVYPHPLVTGNPPPGRPSSSPSATRTSPRRPWGGKKQKTKRVRKQAKESGSDPDQ